MLKKLAFALSLTLVTLAVPAQAQLIGFPPQANNGNCIPFGCAFGGLTRYQQVYDASNFAAPFKITDISFFNTAFLNNGFLNSGQYTFFLSHTAAPVNALAPGPGMGANVGADNALFGSYALCGCLATTPGVLDFASTTGGFDYDPSMGSLLLDIQIVGISHTADNSAFLDTRFPDFTLFSRAWDNPVGGGADVGGLVTEFNATMIGVVPEPGTVFLLATGLVGLGMVARRRQKGLSMPG